VFKYFGNELVEKIISKKLEPQPEPIKEIIHIPYETIMLRARIQEPAFTRVGYMVDSNYIVTQVKNQLATELLEQIVNQNLIEFKQVQEFGQNMVEAQILVSIKK
jgi:hypothetical protein